MEQQNELPEVMKHVNTMNPKFDPYGYVALKYGIERDLVKEEVFPDIVEAPEEVVKTTNTKKALTDYMEEILIGKKVIERRLKILQYSISEEREKLRVTSVPVIEFDQDLKDLSEKMVAMFKFVNGYAIAAPQVGTPIRMFVLHLGEDEGIVKCPHAVIVNPEIIEATGKIKMEESCLSFPNLMVKSKRKSFVRVKYQDVDGNFHEYKTLGVEAVIFQHEISHLDGQLIDELGTIAKIR